MNISDLNKLSIKEYLAKMNIYPVKDRGYYGMYHSLFREDKNPSLKVDFSKNLWIDFGSNEGGTMIDLVMRINNYSLKEAIDKLKRYDDMSVNQYDNTRIQQPNAFSFHGTDSGIKVFDIRPLNNPALLNYLKKRYIDTDIAKLHCKEVHYSVNNRNYFAVGFPNNSDGYELRSEHFQGCTNKDITTYSDIDTNKESCLVFEGFMDYLSYLTLNNLKVSKEDTVILNSVHNLSKAMDFIKLHSKIYCYLDNDEAGRNATQQINRWSCTQGCTHIDKSTEYSQYKDLNEYLVSTRQIQQKEKLVIQEKRKPSRGFRP